VINDKLFKALMDALMAKITSLANSSNSGNNEVLYTYIQTIGVIRHALEHKHFCFISSIRFIFISV
jgi:hypothetical protein